jgi:hypothetical protein
MLPLRGQIDVQVRLSDAVMHNDKYNPSEGPARAIARFLFV